MENKKGVIPDYENDIFISYAHIDNRPYAEGHQGWVDKMHQDLARRLAEVIGHDPKIWRDPELTGSDVFNDTIIFKLANTAILVAVLSPRYVISKSCMDELKEFYQRASEAGGIKIDTKARIFKVVKTPIEEEEQPPELKGLLGYKFYELDPKSGRPREFSHEIGFKTFEKFLEKLDDLAWDIKEFAKCQRRAGKTVYLAETATDLESVRDQIKRELQFYGYCVLPDRDYPYDQAQLQHAIREDLKRSNLSIHLIGENYDDPAHRRPQSLVRLQHELAVARGNNAKFSHLIWMPKGLQAKDADQQQLVSDLWRDAGTHPSVEVLQVKREDLKTNILDKLKMLERLTLVPPTSNRQPEVRGYGVKETVNVEEETPELLYVYLIYDGLDFEATAQLRKFLYEERFELLPTVIEGEAEQVIKAHQENLQECDAAIVFYGQASVIWMQQKLRELRKVISLGRSTELLGKALYISAPMTKQKEEHQSNEVKVIKDSGEFPPEELRSFLREVREKAQQRRLKAKGAGR